MKNIFTIFTVCFVLSSCRHTPVNPPLDLCKEKQVVVDAFKLTFKNINEVSTPLDEGEVNSLVKPLSKNFTIGNEVQCPGYTEQIINASKTVIRKRADEISPILLRICSRIPNPEIKDVSLLAAMDEERMGAKAGLIVLNKSTNECLAN